MFGIQKGINKGNGLTKENQAKDLKKLAVYVTKAKGNYRTINGFAAECKIDSNYMADVINSRIGSSPTIKFLQIVSDNSEGRVSLKELKLACGYSLYENNDLEQIKNIQVRRGEFHWVDFGDKSLDSEVGGHRVALIFQNDMGNRHSSNTIALPLTSRKTKAKLPTHVELNTKECNFLQYDSIVCCELPQTITKRRLVQNGIVRKLGDCPIEIMYQVEVARLKAEGTIDLNVCMEDAVEILKSLNRFKISPFAIKNENTYNNGYNYGASPSMVFA